MEEIVFDKRDLHKNICERIHETYLKKNADYGDSYKIVRDKIPNIIIGHLTEKLSRLETLLQDGYIPEIEDERIEDTLLDIANYAIIEIVERKADWLTSEKKVSDAI